MSSISITIDQLFRLYELIYELADHQGAQKHIVSLRRIMYRLKPEVEFFKSLSDEEKENVIDKKFPLEIAKEEMKDLQPILSVDDYLLLCKVAVVGDRKQSSLEKFLNSPKQEEGK